MSRVAPSIVLLSLLALTSSVHAQQAGAVTRSLDWLVGCWSAERGALVITERWRSLGADAWEGTSRTVRRDSVLSSERVHLSWRGDTLVYAAFHANQPPAEFRVVAPSDLRDLTFANPAHDFPQRIRYRAGKDSLHARIEGERNGQTRGVDYPYARATCDAGPVIPQSRDDAFLDTVQVRTFRWFWETTDPRTGLTPDRWPTKGFSSIAAIGFGLSAYVVGAERGWVTREQAAQRTLNTLRFMFALPQGDARRGMAGYRGFFYHFLVDDGLREAEVELSTIDTSLLLAGILLCQQYFDAGQPSESAIRAYADSIYRRVDWQWIRPRPPFVSMGWKPEQGFLDADWKGYNEAMLLYVLALGSPTHPLAPDAWRAWTSTYEWSTFHGQPHVGFAPLFGHQYSHVWIDFRGIQDEYMREKQLDYFENSRRATLAQRAYAIANPMKWRGYDGDVWGLTAADGPKDTAATFAGERRQFWTYSARGAAANEIRDDGTLAPTAAGGSIPFAPEIAIPALRAMRDRYGDHLFTRYGFLDSFNPSYQFGGGVQHGMVVPGVGWFDGDHLGIDQGPILLMIENHRTGLLWRLMRESPYIVRGLCRAGFSGGWLGGKCEGLGTRD